MGNRQERRRILLNFNHCVLLMLMMVDASVQNQPQLGHDQETANTRVIDSYFLLSLRQDKSIRPQDWSDEAE